jgi:hypothetical protein
MARRKGPADLNERKIWKAGKQMSWASPEQTCTNNDNTSVENITCYICIITRLMKTLDNEDNAQKHVTPILCYRANPGLPLEHLTPYGELTKDLCQSPIL